MTRLIVLRHPPVLEPHLCYGRLDVPVASEDEALRTLEESFPLWRETLGVGTRPLRLRSSPRRRCVLVAEWLSNRLAIPIAVEARLAEMDLGSFEGTSYEQLGKRPDFQTFMEAWQTATAPSGESLPVFERRVAAMIRACVEDRTEYGDSDGNAPDELWTAHSGTIRALRVLLEGKTWPEVMRAPVPYLTPISFTLPRGLR